MIRKARGGEIARVQLNFRCDKMLRDMVYQQTEDTSKWIREACCQRLEREGDPGYLKNKRQELQDSIKKLDQQLKSQKDGTAKIQAILDFGYTSYKTDWVMLQDEEQCAKIQSSIIPKLREADCSKYSILDVLKIFRKRYAKEKGLDV